MSARTFWMSFTDSDKPKGSQFLGVCIVDVHQADVDAVLPLLAARFPARAEGSEWIAAATRIAWGCGCNPGGEVLTAEITGDADAAVLPRNRLLTKAELAEFGQPIGGAL